MKREIFAVALLAWIVGGISAPARAQQAGGAGGEAMVSKALAGSNIEARGMPAFRMEARIRVDLGQGRTEDGKLVWLWTPARWSHNEMNLGDFQRVNISGGRRTWMTGTLDYVPFPAFLTQQAVNILGRLRQARGQKLGSPEVSSATGENCVANAGASPRLRYCFDPLRGNLTRVVDNQWNVTFRYSDYQPFGSKSFPRLMEVLRSDQSVFVEIHIVQLARMDSVDLQMFLPVKGAKELALPTNCGKIKAAKLKKMVQPKYPAEAEKAGISGLVKLYVEIGTDGVPRGMWPVNFAAPVLANAAIDAVRKWRYDPRTCTGDGTKLQQVGTVTVVFASR